MHLGCETVDDVGKARLVASCTIERLVLAGTRLFAIDEVRSFTHCHQSVRSARPSIQLVTMMRQMRRVNEMV